MRCQWPRPFRPTGTHRMGSSGPYRLVSLCRGHGLQSTTDVVRRSVLLQRCAARRLGRTTAAVCHSLLYPTAVSTTSKRHWDMASSLAWAREPKDGSSSQLVLGELDRAEFVDAVRSTGRAPPRAQIRVSTQVFVRIWRIVRKPKSVNFFAFNDRQWFESHPLRQTITATHYQ